MEVLTFEAYTEMSFQCKCTVVLPRGLKPDLLHGLLLPLTLNLTVGIES